LPRKTDSKSPADWLSIAEAELAMLRPSIEAEQFYDICRARLAEVLEKALKAELIRIGWPLAKTHDLETLGGELHARQSDLFAEIDPLCASLADAYFTGRYPGFDLEDPDWPALRAQLEALTALATTIRSRLPLAPP
jgi:HEPN domain-containing protein